MSVNGNSIAQRIDEYRMTVIYRWRSIAVTAAALFALLFVVVMYLPDTYEATTTILVYPQKVPEKYVATTVIEDPNDRLNMLQQEILSSTRLLEVIQKFGLYQKLVRQQGRDAAVDLMRRQIKIQTKHATGSGSSAFTLTFTGNDAKLVAQVTNELANSFIEKNLANRQQQVQGTTEFLTDELDGARKDLEAQEAKLRDYRMGHLGEMPEQMPANLQAIGQLQVQYQTISDQLARLEQEKLLLENAPEADPSTRPVEGPSTASALRDDLRQEQGKLADLLTHETPSHPDVIASQAKISELKQQLAALPPAGAISNEGNRVTEVRLQVLEKERAHLQGEQAQIMQRLNTYQGKVDAVPLREEQLSSLTRDYETARDHYRSLLEKHYSAQMATELETKQDAERFDVLDPATPPDHPTGPNRPLLLAASALFALIGGLAIAFSRDQIDFTIKSEEGLMKILPPDLELLGIIPNISPQALVRRQSLSETS
jgi:polysaccharide chain length determinant protein (PEP-CTERM system associated)